MPFIIIYTVAVIEKSMETIKQHSVYLACNFESLHRVKIVDKEVEVV